MGFSNYALTLRMVFSTTTFRMKQTISEKMDEDPTFYCRFSELTYETIGHIVPVASVS